MLYVFVGIERVTISAGRWVRKWIGLEEVVVMYMYSEEMDVVELLMSCIKMMLVDVHFLEMNEDLKRKLVDATVAFVFVSFGF